VSQNAVIERALLRVVLLRVLAAELAGLAFLLLTHLATDSLALLAQFARHGCLVLGALIEVLVVRAALRSVKERYAFGLEKLERSCQLILGLVLIGAGAWIVATLAQLAEGPRQPPMLAALAATCHAAWLLWAWPALAPRSATRPVALAAQALLTAAALSPDADLSRLADLAAGALIAALAVAHGVHVLFDSLRDLLDYPADAGRLEAALQALESAGLPRHWVRRLRSREVKQRIFLHLVLTPADGEPPAALAARLARARAALDASTLNVDVVFSLESPGGSAA